MPIPPDHADRVRERLDELEQACRAHGLSLDGRHAIDYGYQVGVSGGGASLTVNVYGGKKGVRTVVGGAPRSPLRAAVSDLVARLDGLPAGLPVVATGAGRSAAALTPVQALFGPGPWIGSDESGKGDYFGPLVAAAVFVQPAEEPALRAAGVRDSKELEDGAARRTAQAIRRLCAGRFAERAFAPEEYNALYAEHRAHGSNLNHLLAEAHVMVLETLVLPLGAETAPPTVIADQFADERLVRTRLAEALRRAGKPVPTLIQAPRAEANVAVAAASILARDRFLDWLDAASERYGVRLPKGGSNPAIVQAAKTIVAKHGVDGLCKVAKLHFATSRRVLG